jgi:hypothetical protein
MTPLPDNADKATTAEWMGYGEDIAEMDRCHDWWHQALAKWLGLPSHSMRVAAGEDLSHDQRVLAGNEEDAILNLQKYVQNYRVFLSTREAEDAKGATDAWNESHG